MRRKLEETQKASSSWESNSRVGGHLAVMAQWQSAGLPKAVGRGGSDQ